MSFSDHFPDIVTDEPNLYDDDDSQSVVAQQIEQGRNIGTLVTSRAAERDGATVRWYGTYSAIAEKDGQQVLIRGHMCTDTVTGGLIVKDKYLTKQLLQDAGVPTPRGLLVASAEDAVRLQKQFGASVVVKPRYGGQGKGVTVNAHTAEEITQAFHHANRDGRGVLVEEYIEGIEFRLVATPDKCFGAIRRLLPHVAGDGQSTVLELIEAKNELRRRNPNNCMLMIPVDQATEKHLGRQGLTLGSVLPEGKRMTVRNVGGISSGGEASECLDLLDPAVLTVARDAIRAIPTMDWGGADILVEKATGKPYLLELNTNAAISNSTYPVYGTPKDVGGPAWKRLLERASADDAKQAELHPVASPTNMVQKVLPGGPDNEASALTIRTHALVRHLQAQGWTTEYKATRLIVANKEGEPDKWFNGMMDERFYASASSLLRRHHIAQQILRDAGLTVPRSVKVQSLEEIKAYHARAETDLFLISRQAGWYARRPFDPDSIEYPGEEGKNLTAQRAQTGRRFRVCASRTQSLALLGEEGSTPVSATLSHRISSTAIDAVHGIPSLPWAFVDLLVRDSAKQSIIVEGVSVKPDLRDFPTLMAGSVEGMLAEIAGLSVP
ncbi:ATP-grasp domain-containing protein [Nesterenkonia muleiensis]|uniref:ATP-grasp domain-containing protein n=1 Tax=Nesterenkonia muleiensis TaxID=2282648 RepID=UPI000E7249B5|nr:ATP-grasp domain-containing protein [Nesterenkonia muleiensis]